jgi:hypothetical protein
MLETQGTTQERSNSTLDCSTGTADTDPYPLSRKRLVGKVVGMDTDVYVRDVNGNTLAKVSVDLPRFELREAHVTDSGSIMVTIQPADEPDGYTDVSVVIGGAEDSFETFEDTEQGDERMTYHLQSVKTAAEQGGYRAEVYWLFHGHSPEPEDCSCAQYLTDHHPNAVYGPEGDDA